MVNKSKIVTYTANIVAKPLVNSIDKLAKINLFDQFPNLSFGNGLNIYGGAFFAALDFLGACSDKVKNSKFTRLSKFVGLGAYTISLGFDAAELVNGNWGAIPKTVLDGLMAYQLGKDTLKNYRPAGKDLFDDLFVWR